MKPTRAMMMGYLVVLMLTAPSCVMFSNPVSDPCQADPDMALFGRWQAVEDGVWADQLIVGRYSPTGGSPEGFPPELMRVDRVMCDKQGVPIDTSNVRLLCFPTRIADKRYLNAAIVSPENEKTLLNSGWDEKLLFYIVFKYRVAGNQLSLQVLDLRGKPEGRRSSGSQGFGKGLGRFVTLADTQNLVELLASEKGDDYFGAEVVFTRIEERDQPLAAVHVR